MKKGKYIFVKWITRNGRRVYASEYAEGFPYLGGRPSLFGLVGEARVF
jgi:hypothetical protein